MTSANREGLQRRLESRPLGRAFLSGMIVFALAAMIVSNLPPSGIRRAGMEVVRPYLDLTGLHQNWNLFAPDPRRATLQLEARIRHADGTLEVWHPPAGDPFLGVYRTFRWRKWAGNVLASSGAALLRPAADWIARTHARGGRLPVEVTIVRRSYVAPPPGRGEPSRRPWRETVLYTARYGEAAG